MTNEQLAVLLRQYHTRLQSALEQIDIDLPEDIERVTRWRYVGKRDGLFDLSKCFSTPLKDPEDWEEYPGNVLLLEPLREVIDDLERAISQLSNGTEPLVIPLLEV